MKKLLITILLFCLLINPALATNTYTTDLELSSSQFWSITDAAQTGLDVIGDITIEILVNLEQLPSTPATAFTVVAKLDAAASTEQYVFQIINTNKLRMIYSSNGQTGPGDRTLAATDDVVFSAGDVGNWVHIAVVCDVSVPSCTFYKNGSAVAGTLTITSATSIYNGGGSLRIGAYSSTPSAFFDGKIDELRIWNDIRTPTEISDNYNCSLAGTEANLVGYWRFDNNGEDSTSNNNDLTNNNSATFQSASLPFTATCGATAAGSFWSETMWWD